MIAVGPLYAIDLACTSFGRDRYMKSVASGAFGLRHSLGRRVNPHGVVEMDSGASRAPSTSES